MARGGGGGGRGGGSFRGGGMARGFNPHEASMYRPPGTQWLDRMRRLHHPRMADLYGQLKDSANDDQSNLLQMIEQFLHTGQFSDGKNTGRFEPKSPSTSPDPTDGDGNNDGTDGDVKKPPETNDPNVKKPAPGTLYMQASPEELNALRQSEDQGQPDMLASPQMTPDMLSQPQMTPDMLSGPQMTPDDLYASPRWSAQDIWRLLNRS